MAEDELWFNIDGEGVHASDLGLDAGWFRWEWQRAEAARVAEVDPEQFDLYVNDAPAILAVEWLVNDRCQMPIICVVMKGKEAVLPFIADRTQPRDVYAVALEVLTRAFPTTIAGMRVASRMLLDLPRTPTGRLLETAVPGWQLKLARRMAAVALGRLDTHGHPDPGPDDDAA